MAELVGGAALGAPFSEILRFLIREVQTVRSFKSDFKQLESTLITLQPMVDAIADYSRRFDRPETLKSLNQMILEGQQLVQRCSKVHGLAIYLKSHLTRKIRKLDKKFLRFCQMDMQVQQHMIQLEHLSSTKSISYGIGSLNLNGAADFMALCSVPEPETFTVGLDTPLKELKRRLFMDGTLVTVVSAPGGCGKTTFVKQLCQDDEVKGKFGRNIFFMTVSSTPNVRIMTQRLFMHSGHNAIEFLNDSDSTNCLQRLLKQIGEKGPVLLVLDDVWCGAESLIEKFNVQLPDYKILVTSRFVFPQFGSPYHLKPLNDEESQHLLIYWLSPHTGGSNIPDKLLQEKILKCCKGFPLAIKVVGRSLCKASPIWCKSQLKKWSECGHSILDIHQELLECLETSLDALDIVSRECFMDMGCFPEDQKIRASTIIDMWVAPHGLNEDGVLGMGYLEYLSNHNLLNLFNTGRDKPDIDGFYNDYFVTQHDLLRELAIGPRRGDVEPVEGKKRLNIEIKEDKFPEWLLTLRHPLSARLLSISVDESFSSRWFDLHCPGVEVLVLNFTSPNYVLPKFIAGMDQLKVLVVTNYGFFPVQLGNLSVISNLPNLKIIRLEKVSVASLDMILPNLRNLEKISLVMCSIDEDSRYIPVDVSDKLLNLVEIDLDYCNNLKELPSWICKVKKLKNLSITNCKLSKLPEDLGDLVDLKILRLNSCIDLQELPGSIGRLCSLIHLDISYCLSLRRLPWEIGSLSGLTKLSMRRCTNCELPTSVNNFEDLEVICDAETSSLWKRFQPALPNLVIKVAEDEHTLDWLHF